MEALQRELTANAVQFDDCQIEAVHWGGGTASMVNAGDLCDAMRLICKRYHLTDDVSITLRAAIANFSGASMPLFKRVGIQRFDLEMLSLDSSSYSAVNHTDALGDFPVICNSFLHAAQNNSLGLVLIYGHSDVPQTSFRRSLLAATYANAAHVSLQRSEGDTAVGDEAAAEQIEDARSLLGDGGMAEYLPGRFARCGCEDRFLTGLAAGQELIGFGLGARTRFDGALSSNTLHLPTYLEHSADFSQITASATPYGN
jgi:oxygen-independent coproporphyrinogen-3 oxidase